MEMQQSRPPSIMTSDNDSEGLSICPRLHSHNFRPSSSTPQNSQYCPIRTDAADAGNSPRIRHGRPPTGEAVSVRSEESSTQDTSPWARAQLALGATLRGNSFTSPRKESRQRFLSEEIVELNFLNHTETSFARTSTESPDVNVKEEKFLLQ